MFMGLGNKHMLMGLAHTHMLMDLAHEHVFISLAYERMYAHGPGLNAYVRVLFDWAHQRNGGKKL